VLVVIRTENIEEMNQAIEDALIAIQKRYDIEE
jgi:hypothetical protein